MKLLTSKWMGILLFLMLGFTPDPELAAGPLAIVSHLTKVKIVESNMVAVRPGSIYENRTYFESLASFPNPGFNYRFVDTGLGTAEPLYPLAQKGHQGNWLQLLFAFFGESFSRHIDHYTSLPALEGCHVDSLYMLRNISEFPKTMYVEERAEGYKQIVIRLEYYTKLKADAECGRHKSNDPDPNFNPMKFLKANTKAKSLADFDQTKLARFEAHIAAIRHLAEEFSRTKWPRFDLEELKRNSLWYYPEGFEEDYGIRERHQMGSWNHIQKAGDLVFSGDDNLRARVNLSDFTKRDEYERMLDFVRARATADFDPAKEPGQDALDIQNISPKSYLTRGLEIVHGRNIESIVSDPRNFGLVGFNVQPFLEPLPQLRLVFQMLDPEVPGKHFEQMYLHMNFDLADRDADPQTQLVQISHYMNRLNELNELRESNAEMAPYYEDFLREFTQRPVEDFSFSSSLTGMWIFGQLSRSYNQARELLPLRIVRDGVDVGYYSSVNDNAIFRKATKESTGERGQRLASLMSDLWVDSYRDAKRMDVDKLQFKRLTCAQCHHMSGRDAVHMSFNDGLDRRITYPMRASEFLYRELNRQLRLGGPSVH